MTEEDTIVDMRYGHLNISPQYAVRHCTTSRDPSQQVKVELCAHGVFHSFPPSVFPSFSSEWCLHRSAQIQVLFTRVLRYRNYTQICLNKLHSATTWKHVN